MSASHRRSKSIACLPSGPGACAAERPVLRYERAMLTRLYVDNYKSLVDLEFRPPRICVLVGENGSGKTTIGSLLHALTRLLVDGASAEEVFPARDLCRWSKSDVQKIELELDGVSGAYRYALQLRHELAGAAVILESESLMHLGENIFRSDHGTVSLFGDATPSVAETEAHPSSVFPFDRRRSFLSTGELGASHPRLSAFKEMLSYLRVLKPDPSRMVARSERDSRRLDRDAGNFASWFRWVSQGYPERLARYFANMRTVFPSFRTLRAVDAGTDVKEVHAVFSVPGGGEAAFSLDLLSEGQRQLLFLYLLLEGINPATMLFLDEPDNFISIREVQPWLSELDRVLQETGGQAIIVSHGTEAMNYLGSRQAFVVTRPGGGPTRIAQHDASDGSMPSEAVLYGDDADALAFE